MRRRPWHPFFIAAYPVLSLLGSNIGQVEAAAAARAFVLALALAGVLLLVGRAALGDWHRAAISASLIVLLFFSYGHLYEVLKPEELGRHRYLAPIFAAILLLGLRWVWRRDRGEAFTPWLNAVGLLWLLIPMWQLARFELANRRTTQIDPQELSAVGEKPDIYYIILDAYTRADVLRETYGIDNSPFREELEALGFFVAGCSLSNYSQTDLGFAATLNLDYLPELQVPTSGADRSALFFLIRENKVRKLLEAQGYSTIAFETGFAWSEWREADYYLGPAGSQVAKLNGFETLLIRSTAISALLDAQVALLPELNDPIDAHRLRVLYALEQLPQLSSIPGPKFVFAHIVAPHKPYIFAPGPELALPTPLPMEGAGPDVVGYRNQVLYLNERMPDILRTIIEQANNPPVIVLQGDHGADEAEPADRLAILNALYLPGAGQSQLDTTLSPVNTFRLIFRSYFGWQGSLLADRSFYSTYDQPFELEPITRACQSN